MNFSPDSLRSLSWQCAGLQSPALWLNKSHFNTHATHFCLLEEIKKFQNRIEYSWLRCKRADVPHLSRSDLQANRNVLPRKQGRLPSIPGPQDSLWGAVQTAECGEEGRISLCGFISSSSLTEMTFVARLAGPLRLGSAGYQVCAGGSGLLEEGRPEPCRGPGPHESLTGLQHPKDRDR